MSYLIALMFNNLRAKMARICLNVLISCVYCIDIDKYCADSLSEKMFKNILFNVQVEINNHEHCFP